MNEHPTVPPDNSEINDQHPIGSAGARARATAIERKIERLQRQQANALALMGVADRLHDNGLEALEAGLANPGRHHEVTGGNGQLPPVSAGVDGSSEAETRASPGHEADLPTRMGPAGRAFGWPGDLPRDADGLRSLRVLMISDEATFRLVRPECSVRRLASLGWQAAVGEHEPHLLLVQSSPTLHSEHWGDGVGGINGGLLEIVELCRQRGVATALWDDEPSSMSSAALQSASAFDHVFTVDLGRIPRYRAALGEGVGVHWLPRAVQASLHHPIANQQRVDGVVLIEHAAESTSSGEPADLDSVGHHLRQWRPIYGARCGGSIDPGAARRFRYAFVGARDPQSQVAVEQCALELLAAGTLVASTFARSLRVLFGELVACSDDGPELVAFLEKWAADRLLSEQVRLLALRRVLGEHTWQDRLSLLAARVWGLFIDPRPEVLVLSVVDTEADVDRALLIYSMQSYPRKRLCLVGAGHLSARPLPDDVVMVPPCPGRDLAGIVDASLPNSEQASRWLALLDVRDHYGPDYLADLAIATRYSDGRTVGKPPSGFTWSGDELKMPQWGEEFNACQRLALRSSLVPESEWRELGCSDIARERASARPLQMLHGVATDHFHYCRGGANLGPTPGAAVVDVDPQALDSGVSLARLLEVETHMLPDPGPSVRGHVLPAASVVEPIESQLPPDRPITLHLAAGGEVRCESQLPEQEHVYVYARDPRKLIDLGVMGELRLHLAATEGLSLDVVALFLDEAGTRIGHVMGPANRNLIARLPGRARAIRLGIRVVGTGGVTIESLVVGARRTAPPLVLGRSRYLLLTDHYPSATDLYRNAFIHRRVRAYQSRGVRVDVFAVGPDRPLSFEEFDGVGVTRGSYAAVEQLLGQNRYDHILVHFLTEDLWSVISPAARWLPVTVWVHGAEINPWWRRPFNLIAPENRERVVWSSDKRRKFWRGLLGEQLAGLQFVFVSSSFAGEAFDDLGVDPETVQWTVIHNPIDTELFQGGTKPPEARLRVWSIRPFASEKYANDLTVEAIVEMSTRPEFQDMGFLIVGDGPLFESTTAPLAGMPNVVVQRGFLTQEQIVDIHREHGVFLVPTRWDSQGVSRDEAMSMGLVPITNAVAAVPEFVDDTCAVLCPAEDSSAIVDGLLRLYHDPELFQDLSRAAMLRVRRQSDVFRVTDEELALFTESGT